MDSNDSYETSKREPFCWIEKPKLRMITDIFSQKQNSAGSARSLVLAFAEIASDRQSDKFEASQTEIAIRAALSVSTVRRILPVFRQLGLVNITRNFVNGIETTSTYELVRGPLAHDEGAPVHLLQSKRATEKESLEERSTARRKSVISSSTRSSSLAEERKAKEKKGADDEKEKRAALIARSTPSATEPNIVITPDGERYNVQRNEYDW